MDQPTLLLALNALVIAIAVYIFIRYGWTQLLHLLERQRRWYDRVLNQQLLMGVDPKLAQGMTMFGVVILAMIGFLLTASPLLAFVFGLAGLGLPLLIVKHFEQKREQRLEAQLVDGINALSSSVRAGLNLIQAMELLVTNSTGPMKQEFEQMLREYSMGLDLNHAMRNASNRIGLGSYRLLFTALEMHRKRGGQAGETLDRIAESIREIQRLEGKLDAITAQGRYQAYGMAAMPILFLVLYYFIDHAGMTRVLNEPAGRRLLIVVGLMVAAGYYWIRRIMTVDI